MSLQPNSITYLCNTVPNLEKMERNLSVILPHVDGAVICTGVRNQEAEDRIKSFPNTTLVYYPWQDSFRDAYQACLEAAPKFGWHLRLDDDEVPTLPMLQNLRNIVAQSNDGSRFDVVEFKSITVLDGVESAPSSHGREMLYRWNPSLHYEVNLHQSLVGLRGPKASTDLFYKHYKSTLGGLRSSCRDFFIAGVWADYEESFMFWHQATGQDPRRFKRPGFQPEPQGIPFPLEDGFYIDAWYEMKDILSRNHPEVVYYRDLDKLLRDKQICQEFKDWAERHNAANDPRPHLSELHAFDIYIKALA